MTCVYKLRQQLVQVYREEKMIKLVTLYFNVPVWLTSLSSAIWCDTDNIIFLVGKCTAAAERCMHGERNFPCTAKTAKCKCYMPFMQYQMADKHSILRAFSQDRMYVCKLINL